MKSMISFQSLFQNLLIALVLLWPLWALAFVFLRWLFMKTRRFLNRLKIETSADITDKTAAKKRLKHLQTLPHARSARG